MKSFFLIILFLIAVKACSRHEVDFIRNPKTNGRYLRPDVINKIQKTNKDILKVMIKYDDDDDSVTEGCNKQNNSSSGKEELEFGIDENCPKPFIQIAYREAETTISCKYPEESRCRVKLFCKENNLTCEVIDLKPSPQRSDGTFVVSETSSSFSVSIRNVSSEHAGTYWCGATAKTGQDNRALLKKIKLEVEDGPGPVNYFIIGAAVVTFLLAAFIFTCRRYTRSTNIRSRESEQHPKEDHVYEEIQEHLQAPHSGISIYVTASLPTNDPTLLDSSTINLQSSSANKADGETVVHEPSSSSGLYYTLNCSQNPSSMNRCRTLTEDIEDLSPPGAEEQFDCKTQTETATIWKESL